MQYAFSAQTQLSVRDLHHAMLGACENRQSHSSHLIRSARSFLFILLLTWKCHDKRNIVPIAFIMPSFDSIRPSKKSRANSDDFVSRDSHHNDNDKSLAKSYTSQATGDSNEKAGFLRKTWKQCKRPG